MLPPPIPSNEAQRLAALHALHVLDTPAEERFDRITRLARRLLQAPIAVISLVDAERQWFKSAQGVGRTQTPRAVSFCGHTILGDGAFVVPDAAADPRFADNPLVTGEPHVAFYAAHPLKAPDGSKVGALCVIDHVPRQISAADLDLLRDLADLVETELCVSALSHAQRRLVGELGAQRRQALLDPLTRLWNRQGILDILHRELDRGRRDAAPVAVIMADLDHFKRINDTLGHPAGDAALVEAARRMRTAVRPYDAVGRFGGEEFLIVLPDAGAADARAIAARLRERVASIPVSCAGRSTPVTVSLGIACTGPDHSADAAALIQQADAALYRAKEAGRNRVEVA